MFAIYCVVLEFSTMVNIDNSIKSICLERTKRTDLEAIHDPAYQIGIWARTLSPDLQAEALVLAKQDFEAFRFSGDHRDLEMALAEHSESQEIQISADLRDDICMQAQWFADLTNATSIRLLLGRVTGNMCRRFHTDVVKLRLLCTYYGPGTLWAEPNAIEEKYMSKGTNEQMIKDASLVHQVATGHVALLKGALHEQSAFGAVLHRSPSIEEFGQSRLVLRIDANDSLFS